MDDTKPAIRSMSIWGGLLAILPLASEFVDKVLQTGALTPHAAAVVTAVGGFFALLGRLKASTKISGLF